MQQSKIELYLYKHRATYSSKASKPSIQNYKYIQICHIRIAALALIWHSSVSLNRNKSIASIHSASQLKILLTAKVKLL
jgi:hypothetical protein